MQTLKKLYPLRGTSQVALVVKNPTANAGDLRDAGSIPGSGRSPEEEMATHFSILAWRIPWTKESDGLQSWDHKESDRTLSVLRPRTKQKPVV